MIQDKPRAYPTYATPGKRLYRFFNPASAHFKASLEHLICKNEIFLAGRNDFNDPYDMRPVIKCDWTIAGIRQHILNLAANPFVSGVDDDIKIKFLVSKEKGPRKRIRTKSIREMKRKFVEYMNTMLDTIGVCCFTDEIQNPLFWSHYAGCYRGVCAELVTTADETHAFSNCMKVNYTQEKPVVIASQTGALHTVYKDCDMDYIVQFGFCTKSIDWSVEKEWRVWMPDSVHNLHRLNQLDE